MTAEPRPIPWGIAAQPAAEHAMPAEARQRIACGETVQNA